ncbi:MAG: hypothetical protein MZV64_06335 [Ignavibacteriales bacterium]|nr:hypothetical protein [Ignavibacteriales bacterium]
MIGTIHQGVELSASLKLFDALEIYSTATLSKNIIKRGNYFIDSNNSLDLSQNRINGFLDFLANLIISYKKSGLYIKLSSKYVGGFYSDNFDKNLNKYLILNPGFVDYNDNKNEAYFTTDIFLSYDFHVTEYSRIIKNIRTSE